MDVKLQDGGIAYVWLSFLLRWKWMMGNRGVYFDTKLNYVHVYRLNTKYCA
jgi:hypothetical protein